MINLTLIFNSLRVLRFSVVLCLLLLSNFVFGQEGFNVPQLDTLSQVICGNLHEFSAQQQAEYNKYTNNQPSTYTSQEDWNPAGVFQCGSFTIYYEDFDTTFQAGFADPNLGVARRQTLCDVLSYVESVIEFHENANPVIQVLMSYSENGIAAPSNTVFLAQAGPYYSQSFRSVAGIFTGFVAQQIQFGIDPNTDAAYDGALQVNFHETNLNGNSSPISYFHSGDPISNDNKFDLSLVLLHEVSHILGFASALKQGDNGEVACENDANSYLIFDDVFGYYGNITDINSFDGHKLLIGSPSAPYINPAVNLIPYPLQKENIWINNQGPPHNHGI